MNRETFYREIGNIDDDLILSASEPYVQKQGTSMVYRIAGIAACFCLICSGIFISLRKDNVYINNIPIPAASKILIPDNETAKILPMTERELLTYYGLEQLPERLGEELTRKEQTQFVLYLDQKGDILYDTNILYYSSEETAKILSVILTKSGKISEVTGENIQWSDIDGVSVMVAGTSTRTTFTAYWADFQLNNLSVRMISDGIEEEEFISAVTEWIRYLK